MEDQTGERAEGGLLERRCVQMNPAHSKLSFNHEGNKRVARKQVALVQESGRRSQLHRREENTDMGALIGDGQDIDLAVAAATKRATVIRPEAVFTRQDKAVTGDNKLLWIMTPIFCQSI